MHNFQNILLKNKKVIYIKTGVFYPVLHTISYNLYLEKSVFTNLIKNTKTNYIYFLNCDIPAANSSTAKEFEPNLHQFLHMKYEKFTFVRGNVIDLSAALGYKVKISFKNYFFK